MLISKYDKFEKEVITYFIISLRFKMMFLLFTILGLTNMPNEKSQYAIRNQGNQKDIQKISINEEIICPNVPNGFKDISDGSSSSQNGEGVYACNRNFDQLLQISYQLLISQCIFNGITAPYGGPIHILYYGNAQTNEKFTIIEKCKFTNNQGQNSGGINALLSNNDYKMKIVDNYFENNKASRMSGSIYIESSYAYIEGNHFINNIGLIDGDEIIFNYQESENQDTENLIIKNNTFERSIKEESSTSLIYFQSKSNFKFSFENNKVSIINQGENSLYLFHCQENSKFTGDLQSNSIYPLDESIIMSGNIKNGQDSNLDFNFTEDFEELPEEERPTSFCTVIDDQSNSNVISGRCKHSGTGKTVFIQISNSKFNNFEISEDGAALQLTNCGFDCTETTFQNCHTTTGGGGAVYIKNTIELDHNVVITKTNFISCKAYYGGAVCILVGSEKNEVQIDFCSFLSNSLFESKNDVPTGGSAIYVTAKVALILHTKFRGQKGTSVRINDVGNAFQSVSKNSKKIKIYKCQFEQNDESEYSIDCDKSSTVNKIEVVECNFKGKLAKGAHYVNDKNLFIIKSCYFEFDNNEKSRNLSFWGFIGNNLLIVLGFASLFTILMVLIVIKTVKSQHIDPEQDI